MHCYLGAKRKALLEYHLLIGDSCPYVFMDTHGRGFVDAMLTMYWQKWMVSHGGAALNSSMCRQLFVEERQSNNAVAGPSNPAAATVMGHIVQQCRKWYDVHYHPRLAQNSVDSMDTWRTGKLQYVTTAAPDLTLSAAPHSRHVIVSDPECESEESEYESCNSGTVSLTSRNILIDLV